MILAIDTSTDVASLALCDGTELRAECTWRARGRHSSTLMAAMNALFTLANDSPKAATAVVVAIGPGSFNGLRVGLSAGKGIALARRVPLVGISTLDSIAFGASNVGRDVWPAIGAGRNEVCLARYQGSGATWRRTTAYMRLPIGDAASLPTKAAVITGPEAHDLVRAGAEMGRALIALPEPWNVPRAVYLAELGRRYLDVGGGSQLDDVEPLYLRRSAAEEKRAAALQE